MTGVVGICIGRAVWLFNCDQYILEIQPEDHSRESRLVWLDDGRIEMTAEQEKMIEPETVAGSRSGGVMDASMYPQRPEAMWRETVRQRGAAIL